VFSHEDATPKVSDQSEVIRFLYSFKLLRGIKTHERPQGWVKGL
jgi:hypothetical protein